MRGYFISKYQGLLAPLDWAEGQDETEITLVNITEQANNWMLDHGAGELSGLIWGFLNTCLRGAAHSVLEGADMMNGLDAWRLVVQHIHSGRNVRLAQLRKLVRQPKPITKLEDVAAGITRYEKVLKDFEAAGGTPPGEQEKKSDLTESLPSECREALEWRSTNTESYMSYRNHVKSTVSSILYHRGKMPDPSIT